MKNKKLWLIFPAAAVFALALLLAVGLILRPLPPDGLAVDDLGVLYWEGDDRATSYTVDIDGKIYTTDVWYMDIFDITDEYKTYTVTVTAKGFLGFKRAKTISYDLPALPEDAFIFTLKPDESGFNVALNPDVAVSGKVIIPSSHDGKPVESVALYGFANRQDLTSVFIPDSVTRISSYAFCDNTSLKRVRLSQSLTSIGNESFRSCSSLKDILLPMGLVEIGREAFWKCASLEHVSLPTSLRVLGDNVFGQCGDLIFYVPNTIHYIGLCAISGLTAFIDGDQIPSSYNLPVNCPTVSGSTSTYIQCENRLINCTFDGEGNDRYLSSIKLTELKGSFARRGLYGGKPYRRGYKFLGWTTKINGKVPLYTAEDLWVISEGSHTWPFSPGSNPKVIIPYGTTLYPIWEKIKTYDK